MSTIFSNECYLKVSITSLSYLENHANDVRFDVLPAVWQKTQFLWNIYAVLIGMFRTIVLPSSSGSRSPMFGHKVESTKILENDGTYLETNKG